MGRRVKRERIEVWRQADLACVELRRGVSVAEPYPRHRHEEYQFCLVHAGGGELFYRGAHHETPAASLFVVHPGEVHANRTETGCSFRSLYLAPELLRAAAAGLAGRGESLPFFPEPMIFDRGALSAYLALHRSLEAPAAATLERESLLGALLARLVARYARSRPGRGEKIRRGGERAAVGRLREYVFENHARNVALGELT